MILISLDMHLINFPWLFVELTIRQLLLIFPQVYIYSSGSRLAQRLIFGNTNYGDLRKYLCGFFDTIVGYVTRSLNSFLGFKKLFYYCFILGKSSFTTIMCRNKKETSSYVEISESVGVDRPSEILFVTDVYQEAIAAKAAGKMLNF